MFDAVGKNYDITNTVLAAGLDARWRRRTRERLQLKPTDKVLDLAAGTAVSTVELVPKVCGDGMHLPFADNTFDAVTISYGLRNIYDPTAALRELARVTKPGGRLTIAEFSTPVIPGLKQLYHNIALKALPAIAKLVSSDPESYEYLADSIRQWPNQEQLATMVNNHGWSHCGWQNLTGGIVALHSAIKPDATPIAPKAGN